MANTQMERCPRCDKPIRECWCFAENEPFEPSTPAASETAPEHGESIAISSDMKLNKRRCEICKAAEGPGVECVSPFTLALRFIGITTGDYAHPACLKEAQKAFGSNEKAIDYSGDGPRRPGRRKRDLEESVMCLRSSARHARN